MPVDAFTEIAGLHVGQRFEIPERKTLYFVVGEGGVSIQPTRPFSLVAVLEPAEGGWDLSVLGTIRITVKQFDEGRERVLDVVGKRIRLQDAHVLCIPPRAGTAVPETRWLFQAAAAAEAKLSDDTTELRSEKTGLVLNRKTTMVIRAFTPQSIRMPNPLEAWGLLDHPLRKDLEHVLDLVDVDPAVSLRKSRRLLKGALRARYRSAGGDPEALRLGQLVDDLESRGLLPPKIGAICRTVLHLSAPGAPPVVEDKDEPAREAHLALFALTLVLQWHHRAR